MRFGKSSLYYFRRRFCLRVWFIQPVARGFPRYRNSIYQYSSYVSSSGETKNIKKLSFSGMVCAASNRTPFIGPKTQGSSYTFTYGKFWGQRSSNIFQKYVIVFVLGVLLLMDYGQKTPPILVETLTAQSPVMTYSDWLGSQLMSPQP